MTARPLPTLEKQAEKIFSLFLALHVFCWTLIPTLLQRNAPLDVMEGFVWGREWQWGYYKHPPLQAWLLEAAGYLFGPSGFGYFGLSALCSGLAIWAVYRTGTMLGDRIRALLAALLAGLILYFNFLSTEFNPNTLTLAIWALTGWAFAGALLQQKKFYWFMLGILFAAGYYAKYSTALLHFSLFLFLIAQKDARRVLLTPWPYLAVLLGAALLAPHVLWLYEHNFMPFTYAASRAGSATNALDHIYFPLKFTASQVLALAPAILLAFPILWPSKTVTSYHCAQDPLRKDLLLWLAFGLLILAFVISLGTGEKFRDMWGMPFLSFIPLWIAYQPLRLSDTRLAIFSILWTTLFTLAMTAFAVNLLYAPQLGFKPLRGHFPGADLSQKIRAAWQKQTGTPLTYIISDAWLGGNVALYAPDFASRPHVFIDGDAAISPWIDPEDVKTKGGVLLWKEGEIPKNLLTDFPKAHMQEPIELSQATVLETLPAQSRIRLGWAILKPLKHKKGDIAAP